jgi:hypothetical protein
MDCLDKPGNDDGQHASLRIPQARNIDAAAPMVLG